MNVLRIILDFQYVFVMLWEHHKHFKNDGIGITSFLYVLYVLLTQCEQQFRS